MTAASLALLIFCAAVAAISLGWALKIRRIILALHAQTTADCAEALRLAKALLAAEAADPTKDTR